VLSGDVAAQLVAMHGLGLVMHRIEDATMAVWLLPFEKVRRVSRCSKFVNVWARGGPIGKHNAKDMCEGRAVVTHKVFENEMNGNFGSNLTKCAREFDGRLSEQVLANIRSNTGTGRRSDINGAFFS